MKRHFSKWLFWFLSALSVLFVFISSDEPLLKILEGSVLESLFVNSISGNSIIFNISMGFVVSAIFYIIVVYLPEKQKQSDVAPQIDEYVSTVISRTWCLVSEILRHSNHNGSINDITKDQFKIACKSVNPLAIKQQFHNGANTIYTAHFGHSLYNDWNFIVKNVEKTMHFLPYVDTGLVKRLNEIRSSNLRLMIGSINEIEKIQNRDLEVWSENIFEVFELGNKLEQYYVKNINKKFKHPYRKT